jgi:DNA polymerase III epsilon subunit-like protein
MRDRFRGFLPVVVDIETGGFNCQTDAILEIAITTADNGRNGAAGIDDTHSRNVEPLRAPILTLRHSNSPASTLRAHLRRGARGHCVGGAIRGREAGGQGAPM